MKKIKVVLVLVLILCLIITLSSCSDDVDDPSEKIIKYNVENEPITLDPQIANDNSARLIILNIYEGLMRLDEKDRPVLGSAESYTSNEENTEYTFKIRNNAKWSNGTELTAEDFKYGIVRALAPETGSETIDELFCIKNAKSFHEGKVKESELGINVSGNNITFVLEYLNEDFLRVLTSPPAMPCNKEFFISTQGQYGREDNMLISNGAFYLKKYGWTHNESIQIRANENYIGEKRTIPAGVDITIGETFNNAFNAISDGTLDCYAISGSDYQKAKEAGMTVTAYDDITWGIAFNFDSKIMKNDNIRKGFITSLNRESIEKNISEHYKVTDGIVPKTAMVGTKNYRKSAGKIIMKQSDNDKKYFADGLKELKIEKLYNVEILCPDDDDIQPVINEMIESWNKTTGYYFNKNRISHSKLSNIILSGNYEIAFVPLRSDGVSPLNILEKFRTNDKDNIFNLKNEEFDSLLNEIEDSSISERIDKIIKAEKYLSDNAIFYPICTEIRYYASASNVTGIIFHQYGGEADFRYATVVGK